MCSITMETARAHDHIIPPFPLHYTMFAHTIHLLYSMYDGLLHNKLP